MMRKMRKDLSVVLCLLMLASVLTVFAGASGVDSLHILNVQPSEDQLRVYTSFSGTNVSAEMFAAELGSVPSTVTRVETAVTSRALVYCIVDTSSALESYAFQRNMDVLNGITETLANGDAMIIRTTCQPASDPLPNRENAQRYIASLKRGWVTTGILESIPECLKECERLSPAYDMVCLVVVTSGLDQNRTAASQNSVLSAVQASRIPVYTISTLWDNEATRILASFSAASPGGTTFSSNGQNVDYTAAGKDVMLNLKQGVVLTLNIAASEDRAAQMDELTLRVQFYDGSGRLEDTYRVFSSDLRFSHAGGSDSNGGFSYDQAALEDGAEGEPDDAVQMDSFLTDPEQVEEPVEGEELVDDQQEAEEAENENGDEDGEEDEEEEFPILLVAGVGGAAAILIIVIVAVVVSNKKKQEAEREAAERAARQEAERREKEEKRAAARRAEEASRRAAEDAARAAQLEEESRRANEARRAAEEQSAARAREEAYRASLRTVRFVGVGENNMKIDLELQPDKIYVLGRSSAADVILNKNDPHLSSRHCQIRLKGDHLDIIDSMSRNGTFVNGVPIRDKGMFSVHESDIVKIGSYDYRILIIK